MRSIVEQKRGYKDQWPFSVRIYKDEATGKPKGDCIIKYEEATSAHAAMKVSFFFFSGGRYNHGYPNALGVLFPCPCSHNLWHIILGYYPKFITCTPARGVPT